MKNCKYCESELEDGQSVCPGCGREWTPEEAPVPEETLPTAEETVEEAAAISADLLAEARGVVPRDKSYTARYAACAVRGVCGDFFIRQGVTFEDMLARPHACDDASLDCVLCENCSL